MTFVLYAEVEVAEYGEEPRVTKIGPFSPEENAGRVEAERVLEQNLTEQGDAVLRIWSESL